MIAQIADRLGVGALTVRSWVRTEQCTVVRELHTARVAHLPVRLRDGAGLVGPLVIPGVTSCLGWVVTKGNYPATSIYVSRTTGQADRTSLTPEQQRNDD